MKCYSCRENVDRDEVRTIAQVIEVCPKCYQQLKGLISKGYFDSEDMVADEVMAEKEMETHFSIFA